MPKDPDLEPSEPPSAREQQNTDEAVPEEERADVPRAAARESRSSRTRPEERVVRQKRRKPKRALPRTEREIDSPKPLTLWLLGVMTSATLVMWGSARLACSYRGDPPKKAPELGTAALARTPKDAAIELAQRWTTRDFAGALELSKGAAAEELKREMQKACGSDPAGCKEKAKALDAQVFSRGALLRQDGSGAIVRVNTSAPDGKKERVLRVEPDGKLWKVTDLRAKPADSN
jgi:hypothetical protein